MKRLIKKAMLDYTNAVGYTPENDIHWSNISSNLGGLPLALQDELTYALMNYSNDTANYQGEHPLSICATWRDRVELKEQFDAQQMTTLTMMIIPEIETLNLGSN